MAWYLARQVDTIYAEESVPQGKDGQPGIVQAYSNGDCQFRTRLLSGDRLWEAVEHEYDAGTIAAAIRMKADYDKVQRRLDWQAAIAPDRQTHAARLAGIRSEIVAGTYDTPERVAVTVDRLAEVICEGRR